MATPANPLDVFVTYIAHYELHATNSFDLLKEVASVDANGTTTERFANGSLLINTRKDAHQHIDNIRFRYLGPSSDRTGAMTAIDDITLEVTEPNGTFFVEKIENLAAKFNCKNLTGGLVFGLKIFFVGRLADGSELTIPFTKIIPMHLTDMSASFSYKGGQYILTFVSAGTATAPSASRLQNGLARVAGYSNKNISFSANTVEEAIGLLEQKLNDNYKNVYDTDLENNSGAREVKYKINLDSSITGKLTLATTEDYTPSAKSQITFTPTVDIGTMVRNVVSSSKSVNEMVAESRLNVTKPMQAGVKLPTFQTMYYLQDGVVNIVYNVKMYEGGSGDTFEFDYFFSGPGKNVDILEFECKFPKMYNWMASSIAGTNLNQNSDSTVPGKKQEYHAENHVHPDTTRFELYNQPITKKAIDALKGDVAFLPATPNAESTGQVRHTWEAVPAARLAFETYAKITGALEIQMTFTIRGHLDILEKLVTYPDGSETGFGVTAGIWIKVNIFNADGSPFFYTGYYRLMGVDNVFQGGQFTQLLTVMMSEKK